MSSKRIAYRGKENVDTRFHDGALRYANGVCNVQVMRANREHPELSQGTDFTYNHAPMLCRWHGSFYLMYLSSPVHEHDGLAHALLTRSRDFFTWEKPEVIFPSIPVPQGIYRGKDRETLSEDARTVVHHRMGFYRAPNDVLLVMTFHGVSPNIHAAPNSGYGMGRVVRRIFDDGSLGDIHVLRVNTEAGWKKEHFPYPWFEDSDDADMISACRSLLDDKLPNGAWWEEERLDTDFFPLSGIKAPSFCRMPDGNVSVIGKAGLCSVSGDDGASWAALQKAEGIFTSGGKCLLTSTGDGSYAILYNPSPDGQHRWPLAAITGENGYDYDSMCCICGEVAPMRYGGYLKNFGPNYVRGIMPGNDDSPDGYTYIAYSMNKEDIWVARLPKSITCSESEPVHDVFSEMTGAVPENWHIYSPLWAQVLLEDGCLALHDSEPYDYAKAVRNFPESSSAEVSISLSANGGKNGRLYIELSNGNGMPAGRIILADDRSIRIRAGDGEWPVATYEDDEDIHMTIRTDCKANSFFADINGNRTKTYALMTPVRTVERLTLRTGDARTWPTPEDDLKNVCLPDKPESGKRLPDVVYKVSSLRIT